MENELRRGYDLPLTENKLLLLLLFVLEIVISAYICGDMVKSGFDLFTCFTGGVIILILGYVLVMELGRGFAKLHIVPEGIAVTLFGKTLRQIPRQDLRFFCGFIGTKHSRFSKNLAVCTHSVEELAEEQERKTPQVLRNARTRSDWAEDMAGKCLIRYSTSIRSQFGFHRKDILLIEWSPERLELLMQMYPGVPWCDLSDKKKLDAQRKM